MDNKELLNNNISINKKICYLILLFFSLVYVLYCNFTYVELPYQTWFDQISIAELYYSGKLQLKDLFSKFGEHGMLANNIIYLINVLFFHGTSFFDVYLNDLNVIISGGILTFAVIKTLEPRKDIAFWITVESIFMFSLIQGSSGAMETQVRLGILFFLLAMLAVDRELQEDKCSKWHFIGTVVLIVLSINVFGTLYSFAGVPCVWAIVFFLYLKNKRLTVRNIIISSVYLLTIPTYLIEYGGLGGGSDKLSLNSFLLVFSHPIEAMKGVFAWYANGILGWAYHESNSYQVNIFLIVGAIVFITTVISVVLFFRFQMYKKTWIPLMCIIYTFGVYTLVYLGRADGWDWFSNEWYTVHIKISLAATIWIYAYIRNNSTFWKIMAWAVAVFFLATGIIGNIYTIKRAPAVHNYFAEKQKYLYVDNADEMPVDEMGLTPLVHSLDATMYSIDIMKKYNLSVYQYWNAYESCPTTQLSDNVVKYIRGRYDDGWCEKEMSFTIHANGISKLEVSYMAQKQQNLTIIINDKVEDVLQLYEGEGKFSIYCMDDKDMVITLKSDYSAQLTSPDTRIASYHISEIRCE